MTAPQRVQFAIVGSGPSGCYLAQSLLRSFRDPEITIFDRLASPFGLIRYGIAADHQHTKTITRQFERLFQHPGVTFAGNVELGTDVSLGELRERFDAVILATGLGADRGPNLPGDSLPGVVGAGVITRTLNAHPDEPAALPDLGSDVVVIGAGNVALDVLRFLVKDRAGYRASDVADAALSGYLADPARRITVLSRSSAASAKADPLMVRELAELPRGTYSPEVPLGAAGSHELTASEQSRLAAWELLCAPEREAFPGPAVSLAFDAIPVSFVGHDRVNGVEFMRNRELVRVPATSVITAVGFAATGHLAELLSDTAEIGYLDTGLYRTGWAKRGPRGAIPENRACAKAVAAEIAADLASGKLQVSAAKLGLEALPDRVRNAAISYEQWLNLEAHERQTAAAERVRQKISQHDRMVAIARGDA